LDGKIWALKANSLTSPLTVTVTANTFLLQNGKFDLLPIPQL